MGTSIEALDKTGVSGVGYGRNELSAELYSGLPAFAPEGAMDSTIPTNNLVIVTGGTNLRYRGHDIELNPDECAIAGLLLASHEYGRITLGTMYQAGIMPKV